MESTIIPVSKNGKRRWDSEQKLAVLQEWQQQGVPLEEVCRRHGLHATQMYRWKKALERGLKDQGELIPRSQVAALHRKVEELERALGRKALEVDVLTKAFELKELKLPEGP
jgi:transposase